MKSFGHDNAVTSCFSPREWSLQTYRTVQSAFALMIIILSITTAVMIAKHASMSLPTAPARVLVNPKTVELPRGLPATDALDAKYASAIVDSYFAKDKWGKSTLLPHSALVKTTLTQYFEDRRRRQVSLSVTAFRHFFWKYSDAFANYEKTYQTDTILHTWLSMFGTTKHKKRTEPVCTTKIDVNSYQSEVSSGGTGATVLRLTDKKTNAVKFIKFLDPQSPYYNNKVMDSLTNRLENVHPDDRKDPKTLTHWDALERARELAAFSLTKLLGLTDLIPPSECAKHATLKVPVLLMESVSPAFTTWTAKAHDIQNMVDGQGGVDSLTALRQAYLFIKDSPYYMELRAVDYLINMRDRHIGNVMIEGKMCSNTATDIEGKQVRCIDNGGNNDRNMQSFQVMFQDANTDDGSKVFSENVLSGPHLPLWYPKHISDAIGELTFAQLKAAVTLLTEDELDGVWLRLMIMRADMKAKAANVKKVSVKAFISPMPPPPSDPSKDQTCKPGPLEVDAVQGVSKPHIRVVN